MRVDSVNWLKQETVLLAACGALWLAWRPGGRVEVPAEKPHSHILLATTANHASTASFSTSTAPSSTLWMVAGQADGGVATSGSQTDRATLHYTAKTIPIGMVGYSVFMASANAPSIIPVATGPAEVTWLRSESFGAGSAELIECDSMAPLWPKIELKNSTEEWTPGAPIHVREGRSLCMKTTGLTEAIVQIWKDR